MSHILIIDDSMAEAKVLKRLLGREGHRVSHAANGQEGVELAKSLLPDLILMDVVMPLLNGFQATRELSHSVETAHIPVVICSSKDSETDKMWAKRQGAKAYLVKPIHRNLLSPVIERLLSASCYHD